MNDNLTVSNIETMSNDETAVFNACLKLFRAVPVKNQQKKNPSKAMSQFTIGHGFIYSPQVVNSFNEKELRIMADVIAEEINITPTQMNASFHKSWGKVRDAPYFQLMAEQAYHYMTTYGFERMGCFDNSTVFIPNERLDIPEFKGGIRLTLINGYTKKQLKEKLLTMINSGMAFKSIDDLVTIARFVVLNEDEVINMKNKEVRTKMYSIMDLIPEDPTELLRLAIFETTGKTLLINNRDSTKAIIASGKGHEMRKLFEQYDEHFGYSRLAESFNRFKRLYLGFKQLEGMNSIINKISHLSKIYHKPMKYSFLNNITGMLNRGDPISEKRLVEELGKVNVFRKIRLAQSIKYRLTGNQDIMYKVRNGKAFATTMNFTNIGGAQNVYNVLIKHIAKDLKHLKGKEFYIPENITYALPATEKQMSGMIPSGSYISTQKDMIMGVHWVDVGERIDLDLSAQSLQGGKIGWDGSYRSDRKSIIFSGDNTSAPAPNGASELFYINKDYEDTCLINLNYFNFGRSFRYGYDNDTDAKVPFKLMIAEEHPNSFGKNYTIDPNHMKCLINDVIDTKQRILGLITAKDGECRFYFNDTSIGNDISVRGHNYISIARNYLAEFSKNQITFNEILVAVGAKIVHTQTSKSIDLSIEALQKDTFINLLFKK